MKSTDDRISRSDFDVLVPSIELEEHGDALPGDDGLDLQFLAEWQSYLEIESARRNGAGEPVHGQARQTVTSSDFGLPGPLLQEAQRLQSRLMALPRADALRKLVFVSAQASEGTSTIVSALALVLARSHHKVLLIDGHFTAPSLHNRFRLSAEPGLVDLLRQGGNWQHVVQATAVTNLYVMTAGSTISDPSTFLDTAEIEKLLNRVKEHFTTILIDAPSLKEHPDSLVWAKVADAVLLVVQAHRTRKSAVEAVRHELLDTGCQLLGVVVNRRKYFIPKWLYTKI
jgi:capsular exopolysaccharide synthesis family protein